MDVAPSPNFSAARQCSQPIEGMLELTSTNSMQSVVKKALKNSPELTIPSAPASVARGILLMAQPSLLFQGYVLPMEYQGRELLARWLR